MTETFMQVYQQVRPIVLKLRQVYHIRLWELSDWEQEGMLVLYQLLSQHPELINSYKLYPYFKTKFSNYVKDQLRKQESQKRRWDKMAYEEISEVAHSVSSNEMSVSDRVIYQEMLLHLKGVLSSEEQDLLERLMAGQRFSGRAKLIKRLRSLMIAYDRC